MTDLFKKYFKIIIRKKSHKAIKIIFKQMKKTANFKKEIIGTKII